MTDDEAISVVDGVVHVRVRVKPRASRSRVLGFRNGAVEVSVQAAPVDGKANGELLGLLARALSVPKSRLKIVVGKTGRNKRVSVEGLSRDLCVSRLAAE